MSRFNIRSLDLNLLSVFVILWDTRCVSRASERLALTQPAVSHALKRLRDRLNDALFVPGRGGLIPTPRAAALINPVREALSQIERAIEDAPSFEPREAQREFRIATIDFVELWVLPLLMEAIRRDAPGVVIRSVALPAPDQLPGMLEAGDIDVAITPRLPPASVLRHQALAELRFATLIWAREGLRGKPFPLPLYLEREHVAFQYDGAVPTVVIDAMAALGSERRVGARVRTTVGMAAVAARTGFVCNLPLPVAEPFAKVFDLTIHEPPIPLATAWLYSIWHARFEGDPALAWLLGALRRVMAD